VTASIYLIVMGFIVYAHLATAQGGRASVDVPLSFEFSSANSVGAASDNDKELTGLRTLIVGSLVGVREFELPSPASRSESGVFRKLSLGIYLEKPVDVLPDRAQQS